MNAPHQTDELGRRRFDVTLAVRRRYNSARAIGWTHDRASIVSVAQAKAHDPLCRGLSFRLLHIYLAASVLAFPWDMRQ